MSEKFKNSFIDSFKAVLPIAILVLLISFFVDIDSTYTINFIISSVLVIIGMGFFNYGADLSMSIIGQKIGKTLTKKSKLLLILLFAFFIGFVITVAEPSLMVLSNQLNCIPKIILILSVGIGVGSFLLIAFVRIIKSISIKKIVLVGYLIIFTLIYLTEKGFITIAFDSGGVATGPVSVPFIVALGYGFTKFRTDRKAKDYTFGLVGLCCIGPIIAVLLLGLFYNGTSTYDTSSFYLSNSLSMEYFLSFYSNFVDCIIAITPILTVFLVFELINNTVTNEEMRKIVLGLMCVLVGLTIFLTAANVGFIRLANQLGGILVNYKWILVILGMIFGFFIVKAEPAVKLLTDQVSGLTGGSLNKTIINLCLQCGVCIAVGLGLIRVIYGFSVLYILIPGYIITLLLTIYTPELFVSVAFDSGGAATGPLTTSFLLPLAIGACVCISGADSIMSDAFGLVAYVSLAPLICVQLLGSAFKHKTRINEKSITKDIDETIVEFEVAL